MKLREFQKNTNKETMHHNLPSQNTKKGIFNKIIDRNESKKTLTKSEELMNTQGLHFYPKPYHHFHLEITSCSKPSCSCVTLSTISKYYILLRA